MGRGVWNYGVVRFNPCAPHFRTKVSVVCETENNSRIFDVPSVAPRAVGSTSVNIQIEIVGRPGLDPGTLGLKGTFHRLFSVRLVAHVHSFQGIVLF
jgi:hypothetical protein